MSFVDGRNLVPDGNEMAAIYEIVNENGLLNTTISATVGTDSGDNYCGLILSVTINGEDKKRLKKQLKLILKHSYRVAHMRAAIAARYLFLHEVFFYTEYLPILQQIEVEKNLGHLLKPLPKLYKHSTEDNDEYMLMEDLKESGFQMLDKKNTLDYEHCVMILKQLAYLHALGYIFKIENFELYSEMTKPFSDHNCVYLRKAHGDAYKPAYRRMMRKAIDVLDPAEDKILCGKLEELFIVNDTEEQVVHYGKSSTYDDRYSIFIHGDCWSNNLLFKYDEIGKPIDLRILDWQIVRIASPAIELSYFLYLCTSEDLREQYDLIKIYHDILSDTLEKCNYNIEQVLPLNVLQEHMHQYGKFGVIFACLMLPMMVRDQDEIPDMAQLRNISQTNTSGWGTMAQKCRHDDIYKERMRGIFQHAYRNNYI